MKNLILGGAGFIGANLHELLHDSGEETCVVDSLLMGNTLECGKSPYKLITNDLMDLEEVSGILFEHSPTRIFHLAANSNIAASNLDPTIDIENTFLTTFNLIQACSKLQIKPEIIFASTSAIYGNTKGAIREESTKMPISPYGWMKLASETILKQAFSDKTISKLLILRFPNVTGRWQTHGVVKDLVHKLKKNSDILEVLGNGFQKKPYMDAQHLVHCIKLLADSHLHGYLEVNLGAKDQISVREIVNELLKISGLSPQVLFGDTEIGWAGDVPNYYFDNSKFHSLFGESITKSSLEAIQNSLLFEWFKSP